MLKISDIDTMNIYGGSMILPLGQPIPFYKIVKAFIQNYLKW